MEVNGQFRVPTALYLEKALGTHFLGSWVGPRGGLDAVTENETWSCIPYPSQHTN
jgi:hypothetical protein